MYATLTAVRQAQPDWFSRGNKRFFGDVNYRVLYSRNSGPYLIRLTAQWSDMFGQPKTYRYRINKLNEDLTIGGLLDVEFHDLRLVKSYLKTI